MRLCLAAVLVAFSLAACAQRTTADIDVDDAGLAFRVKFGTVLAHRRVSARSDPSSVVGAGALAGGLGGALIAQTNGGAIAGLVLGGLGGGLAHRYAETDNAVEYTIALQGGETVLVTQAQGAAEEVFAPGAAVLVQFGARTNRVLPARDLPPTVAAPRRVQVEGAPRPPDRADVRTCLKSTIGETSRESCTQH